MVHSAPFSLTREMGKSFLENSISLGQYMYLEGSVTRAFAETLLSSYPIYSEQLDTLFFLSQLILTSAFPCCIVAACYVGGWARRS